MPTIKIIIKRDIVTAKEVEGVNLKIKGEGINRTISMSKTKKITAKRKNRVEKGKRALFFGSNPHSKGVLFSRSLNLRLLNKYARVRTSLAIVTAIKKIIRDESIHTGSGRSISGLKAQRYCKLLV